MGKISSSFESFILPSRSQRGKVSKYFVDVRPIRRKLNRVGEAVCHARRWGKSPLEMEEIHSYRHFKLAPPSASLPNPHSTHPSFGHQIGYPDKNATSFKKKIEPKNYSYRQKHSSSCRLLQTNKIPNVDTFGIPPASRGLHKAICLAFHHFLKSLK